MSHAALMPQTPRWRRFVAKPHLLSGAAEIVPRHDVNL